MKLKDSIIQAPILHYPNPNKKYIVYTDASDNACKAQLSQEHNGMEFPITFCLTPSQKPRESRVQLNRRPMEFNYSIIKWNYYLQGADITVRNDHKPFAKFLNGKNATNKVNRWGLKLATYNITFKWISGAKNKAADCLSCLIELPSTPSASINMVSVSNKDGPAFNTRSQTQ